MSGFTTCVIDPPWNETGGGRIKRGADRHYSLMKARDMPEVITSSGVWAPAEHAHLWLWVTNNRLADGLWLMEQVGFRYVTNVVWVKTADPVDVAQGPLDDAHVALADTKLQIGLGQYLRGSHELLLFGVRGKGQHPSVWQGARNIPSVIRARRTKHSRKPEAAFELIESVSRAPRLEMFARTPRDGWASWCNEV